MWEQGPGSPSGAGAPSPDAGTVPARGRAWGMQGRADLAPGVRGPVLVPAPPEQGLGRGRHGRPPCTLTHRRNEPTGKGACTRRGLGPARRQDQRPVAFPGRPISRRGRSASGEDAPTPPITAFSRPRPTWPGSCYQAKRWPQLRGLRPLPPRVGTGRARAGTRPAPPRPPRPALGTPQWGKPSPLCPAQSGLQTRVQGSEKRVVVTPLGSRSRLGSFEGAAGSLGSPRPVPLSALRDGAGVSHPRGQLTPTRLPASADFRRRGRSQKSAPGVTGGGEGSLGGLALRLAEVASLSSGTVHRYPQTDALLPQREAPLP